MGNKRKIAIVCAALAAILLLSEVIFFPYGLAVQAASDDHAVVLRTLGLGILQEESNQDKLTDAKKDAAAIKAERKSAQQRLDSLKADRSDMESYVKELDKNMLEVQEIVQTLSVSMEEKQKEIKTVQAELEVYRETQEKQQEAMKLRIQFMYENGQTQYLDLLFESESLVDLLRQADYISEMIRYDRDQLLAYQKTCQDVVDTEKVLLAEYEELADLREVNEDSLNDLEALLEAKNKEIQEYTKKINDAQAEVNSYSASLKKQEDLIKKIENDIRKEEEQNKVNANSGQIGVTFKWPIPASSRITSKFGPRKAPVAGASNYHKGVDVGAPTGTPVYAAAAGTVVISEYNYSAGEYVMINHGNGVYTVYMHFSKRSVKVGQKVSQGDKIGEVGSTGYSTGPHLHFGVRINGKYYDPLKYVVVP